MNNIHTLHPLTQSLSPKDRAFVLEDYVPIQSPAQAIRTILVKHHRQSEADAMFAVYPELRSLAERTAGWITEVYPTTTVYPKLLEGALLRSMDAYSNACRPRANQNDALHAFVNTFCASAAEVSSYSVMAVKSTGERLYWQLFSKPLSTWLEEVNPAKLEFRLLPESERNLSPDLVRTYLACHVVDFNTLHGLDTKTSQAL